jgi:CHAT domain-containing protein
VLVHNTVAGKGHTPRGSETVLSIGNPAFDRHDFPELDDLPAAAREAEGIAALYSRSYRFTGPRAVKAAIEKRLPEANVIHFAGHYVTNQLLPLQSKLVLAKQHGSTETDLTVGELIGRRLPNVKLVILSACQTSGKDYYNGEGLTGIARAFLELGTPLVVASHWPVESDSTAELMLNFHRYRKELGLTSVAALRKAQLGLLNAQNGYFRDPYYWAAYTPFGGYVEY